jgi:hypothetical protein
MVWAGSFPMGVYTSVQASTEAQPSFAVLLWLPHRGTRARQATDSLVLSSRSPRNLSRLLSIRQRLLNCLVIHL